MKLFILKKRYALLMIIAVLCIVLPVTTHAETNAVDIQIQTSIDGKVKEGFDFPVRITLHNTGPDIIGEVSIEIGGNDHPVIFAQSVDLPRNSEKVIWMSLPGTLLNSNNNKVKLYNIQRNKRELVPFNQGEMSLTTTQITNRSQLIGVLAADKDTFNFVQLLNNNMDQYYPVHLTKDSLPDQAHLLSLFDRIVINDYATGQLSERQILAIQTWVESGGQLVVAGGANYPKAIEAFNTLSPIAYEGTVSVNDLESLSTRTGRDLAVTTPVTLSYGTIIDGKPLLSENEVPLFVNRPVKLGSVLYVAYDLSLNPLASWNGNSTIWGELLKEGHASVHSNPGEVWRINEALNHFSELTPPDVGFLILLFIGYVVLVVPVLFFVLKKWDRRELAWVLVPTLAVVMSVATFIVGSVDRMSLLAQSLNVIEMNSEGHGFKKSYISFFAPSGGSYTVDQLEGHLVSPIGFSFHCCSHTLTGSYDQKVYQDEQTKRMHYQRIPYRSIGKLQSMDTQMRSYASLDYELKIQSSRIAGQITNTTEMDLRHVSLFMNGSLFRLGDLQSGEQLDVQQAISGSLSIRNFYGSLRYTNGFEDLSRQEEALLSHVLNTVVQTRASRMPFITAISEGLEPTIAIDGKPIEAKQFNVWLWHIDDLDYVDGNEIDIPSGVIVPIVVSSQVNHMYDDSIREMFHIGTGSLEVNFNLLDIPNAVYSDITIESGHNSQLIDMFVWNFNEQEWDQFLSTPITLSEEYIDRDIVKLMYVNDHDEEHILPYPRISAKGMIVND